MRETGYIGAYRGYAIYRDAPDRIRVVLDGELMATATSMGVAAQIVDILIDEARRAVRA